MICKGCKVNFNPDNPRRNFCTSYCYKKWWYNQNIDKNRKRANQYKLAQKKLVFEYFGGCFCADCKTNDIDVLTLDHLKGGGQRHRLSFYKYQSGSGLYSKFSSILRKGGTIPMEYEVVCRNCNWKRYLKKLRI